MRPPKHLTPNAKAKWREIHAELAKRGEVDRGTLDSLEQYCVAWATWLDALHHLQNEGHVSDGDVSPWQTIAERSQRAIRQWATELKLTPRAATASPKSTSGNDPILGNGK